VALKRFLGCACIFSLGPFQDSREMSALMDRRENNGIVGSHFYQQGWFEMLWILMGLAVCLVALFVLLRIRAAKKTHQEIAF
jgi:hypothetical protein